VPNLSNVSERILTQRNVQVSEGTLKFAANCQEVTARVASLGTGQGGTQNLVKTIPRIAATIFAGAAALGLAGVGAAAGAQAQPAPFPDYHWCPGEWWDPGWGFNWEGNNCHDDHHRDMDGWDHSHDWNGGGPGWDHDHPGGPGWDHDHPGGPGWQR